MVFKQGHCIAFLFKWINPNLKTQAEAGNDNGPARPAQLRTALARELPDDLTRGTHMSAEFKTAKRYATEGRWIRRASNGRGLSPSSTMVAGDQTLTAAPEGGRGLTGGS